MLQKKKKTSAKKTSSKRWQWKIEHIYLSPLLPETLMTIKRYFNINKPTEMKKRIEEAIITTFQILESR